MIHKLPSTSVDLIELLDKKYPERSPDPKDDDREIWMKAGERRLVRELIASLNVSTENHMKGG